MRASKSFEELHAQQDVEEEDDFEEDHSALLQNYQRFEIEHGGNTMTPENTPSPPPRPMKVKRGELLGSRIDFSEDPDLLVSSNPAPPLPQPGIQTTSSTTATTTTATISTTSIPKKTATFQAHRHTESSRNEQSEDDHVHYTASSYQHTANLHNSHQETNTKDIIFSPSRKSTHTSSDSLFSNLFPSWMTSSSNANAFAHLQHQHDFSQDDDNILPANYPRLIERSNDPSIPSNGNIFVRKRIRRSQWFALYGNDWFHTLLDAPTSRIILILLTTYVFVIVCFAIMYYFVHLYYYCDLDFGNSFVAALDFSLETMATIGYGTKNIYFDNCMIMTSLLMAQICIRLIVDGVVVGVVYSRYSSSSNRASTLIFSDRLIVRRIRGKLYLMFQLCELRKRQLVEAHVRLYVVKKEVDYDAVLSSGNTPKILPGSVSYQQLRQQQHQRDQLEDDFITTNSSTKHGSNSPLPSNLIIPGSAGKGAKNTWRGQQNIGSNREQESLLRPKQGGDKTKASTSAPTIASSSIHAINSSKYTYLQTCNMRLSHPDDSLGGMLLLMLPQLVVHELDATSPLMPPPYWIARTASNIAGKKMKMTKKKLVGGGGMYEEIRWSPPCYRHLQVPSQSPYSSKRSPGSGKYDMEVLSSMSFPNVMKRSTDYHATCNSKIREREMQQNNEESVEDVVESNEEDDQIMKTPTKANGKISSKNQQASLPVNSTSSVYHTARNTIANSVTASGTGRRTDKVSTSQSKNSTKLRKLRADYHSPGMQRYMQDMHVGSAGGAKTNSGGSGKRVLSAPRSTSSIPSSASNHHNNMLRGMYSGYQASSSSRMTALKEQQIDDEEDDDEEQSTEDKDEQDDNDEEVGEEEILKQPRWQVEEKEMIQRYLLDREVEIIAIIEVRPQPYFYLNSE